MPSKWYEIIVRAPAGNGYDNPEAMKRVDDHILSRFRAAFNTPDSGLPVQSDDGTFSLRVFEESQLDVVKFVLTSHYGLEIVSETEH
jgi:hypothetical protein